jgi:hypothetical protein
VYVWTNKKHQFGYNKCTLRFYKWQESVHFPGCFAWKTECYSNHSERPRCSCSGVPGEHARITPNINRITELHQTGEGLWFHPPNQALRQRYPPGTTRVKRGETIDIYDISPSSTVRNKGKEYRSESTPIVYN